MSTPTISHTGDNRVLNVLRSVSAFAVVIGHVRLLFIQDYASAPHTPLTAILYAVTSLGSQAVIVFFVLSGYFVGGGVIARFRRENFSWFDYVNSRLTRLWLVLIPALVLTFLVDLTGGALFDDATQYRHPDRYVGMNVDPTLSPLAFLGNAAFLQGLHVPIYGTNNPLWSLAYEAWYYLLFPAILSLLWRAQTPRNRVMGGLLVVGVIIVVGTPVLLLFPCWLLGALVGAYRRRIAELLTRMTGGIRASIRILAVTATLLVAIGVRLQDQLPLRLDAWSLALVTAVMVAVFVSDVGWRGRPGRIADMVSRTAHSSYSLYAVHMPVVVIVAAWAAPDPELRVPMTVLTLLMCVGVVLGVWVIASAFARVTEMQTDRVKSMIERLRRSRRVGSLVAKLRG